MHRVGDGDFGAGSAVEADVDRFGGSDELFCGFAVDFVADGEAGIADSLDVEVDFEGIADFHGDVVVCFGVDNHKDKLFFMENLLKVRAFAFDEIF